MTKEKNIKRERPSEFFYQNTSEADYGCSISLKQTLLQKYCVLIFLSLVNGHAEITTVLNLL